MQVIQNLKKAGLMKLSAADKKKSKNISACLKILKGMTFKEAKDTVWAVIDELEKKSIVTNY